MDAVRSALYAQWDRQVNLPQAAYIEMNNLYLRVERGEEPCTLHVHDRLMRLLGIVYPAFGNEDVMRNYWLREFDALPGFWKC